jgi:hypothetical protein
MFDTTSQINCKAGSGACRGRPARFVILARLTRTLIEVIAALDGSGAFAVQGRIRQP